MANIPKDYKIVPFNGSRFAIADAEGNIVDNAQNWGYKTKQAAYKAANYKMNKGKIDSDNSIVVSFMKKNNSFSKDVEAALFYAVKDRVDVTPEDLEEIAKENSLELPFPAEKFLKIMMRKSCKW